MKPTWILLKFNACCADEFDCESIIVTTKARWEKAKDALQKAYPNNKIFYASFGSNEGVDFTADSYISSFDEHEISLQCAKDMARTIGRSKGKYDGWNGATFMSRAECLLIEHGVLPYVPDEPLSDWILMLAFDAPPARCKAHGNIIGKCPEGSSNNAPIACRNEPALQIIHLHDPDYEALVSP